jgi:glycosyltransferase involved in cell wall biosynthesis
MRARFVFVLEQTLGHAAHAGNIEHALEHQDWIEPTIIRLPFGAGRSNRLPGLNNWSIRAGSMARHALRRRLADGPVDAIFIHTQVASLLSIDLMRRTPTVVSLDATPKNFDDIGSAYGHSRSGRLAEWAKAAINRRAFGAASQLVTWSRLASDSLITDYQVPAAKIHVIPPGVDLGVFRPLDSTPIAGPVRILFVGGDFVRKGGPELLTAMSALSPNVELDVVTGSDVVGIPSNVTCRVHRGLKPRTAELIDLYRRADIFALPSRGDCLPQVLAEAAAAGLPLVATPTGAVPEIVRDGENGFLVPIGSAARLASALRLLVDDPTLRRRMGHESMVMAAREHDAAANNARIFDLMATAAGQAEPIRIAAALSEVS